ncbi:MAG: sterol desaturase family protein [Gammaproteobacteria bacterium]|nr:sterol desaturase family protein [Gammaproteobacteria bacterium]
MEAFTRWTAIATHDLSQFIIIVGTVYLVVNVILAAWLKGRRIQQHRLTTRQLGRELSSSLLTVMIFSGMGWLVHFGPLRGFVRLYTDICEFDLGIPGFGWAYVAISLLIVILAHDAYFYWTHRLLHQRGLYRYFHRLHHRSITPAATTAYAFAPGEAAVHALFLPLILLIVPLHPVTEGLFMIMMIARNTLAHTGIEVFPAGFASGRCRWSATVTHHDLHHQHGSGNYGFYFTWWDRFMGTERGDYVERFRRVTERNLVAEDARCAPDLRLQRGVGDA